MSHHSQTEHHFNFTRVGVGSLADIGVKNHHRLIWNLFVTHLRLPKINDDPFDIKSLDYCLSALITNHPTKGGLQMDYYFTQHIPDICEANEPAPTLTNTIGINFLFY
jgi:hypothetical protein